MKGYLPYGINEEYVQAKTRLIAYRPILNVIFYVQLINNAENTASIYR